MQIIQEIRLSYARIQLLESRIIRLHIFGDHIIGGDEAKEMNEAIGILSGGREHLVLILAAEITQFNREALEFSTSDEGLCYTIASAMVVRSLAQRITANFYLAVNAPKKPSRIFNSEAEAVEWLQTCGALVAPLGEF